jgi:replicative DNA helicase
MAYKNRFERMTTDALLDEYIEMGKVLKGKVLEKEKPEFNLEKFPVKESYELLKNSHQILPIKNYLPSLDSKTHGYAPGELIVIAGQTGQGKSLLMINMLYQLAMQDFVPSLFLSLEMTKAQTGSRFINLIDSTSNKGELEALPIYTVGAKTDINLKLLEEAVKEAVDKLEIKLVAIDHLHYFVPPGADYLQQIDRTIREIKQMAVRYNLPIFLISHTRKIQTSEPTIEDLKSTSTTGQDADIIEMVSMDWDAMQLKVQVLKNRNRANKGAVTLQIDKNFMISEFQTQIEKEADNVFSK